MNAQGATDCPDSGMLERFTGRDCPRNLNDEDLNFTKKDDQPILTPNLTLRLCDFALSLFLECLRAGFFHGGEGGFDLPLQSLVLRRTVSKRRLQHLQCFLHSGVVFQ